MNIKIDPTGKITEDAPKGQLKEHILDACGLIPHWVVSWNKEPEAGPKALFDFLDITYGFGMHKMGGTLDADGTYRYPQDPPLYPLISMETRDGTLYQYDYGIVAIPMGDQGGHFITRMD